MNEVAGLGTFGFWMFIAAVVVGGMWFDARKKESQQETLRRLVESGKEIAPALLEQLTDSGDSKSMARDLKVASYIVMSVAPGLATLGYFLSKTSEDALLPLLGVSALLGFIGIGLYLAARLVERRYADIQD